MRQRAEPDGVWNGPQDLPKPVRDDQVHEGSLNEARLLRNAPFAELPQILRVQDRAYPLSKPETGSAPPAPTSNSNCPEAFARPFAAGLPPIQPLRQYSKYQLERQEFGDHRLQASVPGGTSDQARNGPLQEASRSAVDPEI